MDRRRIVGLFVTVVGIGALVVGMAGLEPPLDFPNGVVVGVTVTSALGGFSAHRKQGWLTGLRWGVLQGGGVLAFVFGLHQAAAWIRPAVAAWPGLVELAWPIAVGGAAMVLGSLLMWERNHRVRRVMAISFVSIGLVWAGMLSLALGVAPAVGAIALALGIVGAVYGYVAGRDEQKRQQAANGSA